MFAPTRYLEWARRFYGRVAFDLASSGIPTVPRAELGGPTTRLDDPAGWESLRAAISAHNDVPQREAVAALGTSHALWLAYATLLAPGDDVLVEGPGYEPLWRIAEGVGANVVRFGREPAERFAIDPARIARAMTPRTKLVVVTNLHNPSGVRASDDALRAAAAVAHERGANLLVDEVYAAFETFVDASGVFRGSARKLAPNIVAVSSLTKCYGVGPDRIGWMLAAPDVIARAQDTITASCGMLPLAHAHFGAHVLARVPALAARTRELLAGKRARVAAWMADHPALRWSAPDAGLFGFATRAREGDLTPAIEAGVRDHGVLVAPGAFFGVPNGFRLAWSTDATKLEEGLARLPPVFGL
jgi:aspartate/methionine/tyrosine aminotransferase